MQNLMMQNLMMTNLKLSNLQAVLRSICGISGRLRLLGFALLATVAASGCTVTPRIDANFNADPQLAPPTAPLPLPPDDSLNWRTEFVTATVVAGAAGGKRIRIAPRPVFIAAPDFRRVFLVAVSEAFTTRPAANMRGSIRLRIIGLGTVGVALRPVQAEQRLDYIGGFALSNFLPPAGASVDALGPFKSDRLDDPFGIPSTGAISNHSPNSEIVVNWTIDQPSHTFSASILGGASASSVFPDATNGSATTPIQRLGLDVWLQNPGSDTVVFIDDIRAEEYR